MSVVSTVIISVVVVFDPILIPVQSLICAKATAMCYNYYIVPPRVAVVIMRPLALLLTQNRIQGGQRRVMKIVAVIIRYFVHNKTNKLK